MSPSDRVMQKFYDVGVELDELLAHAKKTLPADRFLVLHGTANKLIRSFEQAGAHLGVFLHQYERLSMPPRGPRGPATIHRLNPRNKPKGRR